MMNVLMVGGGKGGSWEMRGRQLGAAIGARVTSVPTIADWRWADLCVLVKRAAREHAPTAQAHGVPIVWDALDFWAQPAQNDLHQVAAHVLFGGAIAVIKPALTIGATQAMADACGGVYLPHHSWDGLTPEPARETVSVVAYQGNTAYLGRWTSRLQKACAKRGWSFVVNPSDLRQADIIVALRDGQWDGFICREWKSGVKLTNAIAAGRPVIGQASAAMREMAQPSTIIESEAELDAALDQWTPFAARAAAVDVCHLHAPALRLSLIADQLRAVLQQVEARCAA